MECDDIAFVILAAGLSKRYGADKLVASLDGLALGSHIARTAEKMKFGWRFAVCGHRSAIAMQYSAMGFEILENQNSQSGQAHSLHLAVEAAVKTDAKAILITLADMPFITARHLARIATCDVLTASTEGTLVMPPALFPRGCWPELLKTAGDTGARALLQQAHKLTVPAEELRDIDVPGDLIRPKAHDN